MSPVANLIYIFTIIKYDSRAINYDGRVLYKIDHRVIALG